MKIAEAFVEIRVDRRKAEREAKDAAESMGKVANDAVGRVFDLFKGAAFVSGIQKAIGSASDLNETVSKTGVIFGDAGDAIVQWSTESAKQLGLSQRAALDAASTFATFGKSAGLAGGDLTGFSKQLVGLSSDLASFYNTSPEQAIEAIGAALRGESEPIRQFGVLLDDATLKQRALSLGIYDGAGALTQQQRALAAQAEILAQTGDAQGDFARTADGVANSQRIAAAEAENSAASFGQILLPVYKRVLDVVTFLVDKFGALPAPIQTAIVAMAGLAAFSGPIGTVKDVVIDLFGALTKVAGGASTAALALGAVGGVLALAGGLYLSYNADKQRAEKITNDFVDALRAEAQGQKDATRALIARQIVDSKYLPLAEKLGLTTADVADVITGKSVPAYDKARAGIDDILNSTAGYNVKNEELKRQFGITANEATNFRAEIDRLATGYGAAVVETAKLDEANKALGVSTGVSTAAAAQGTSVWNTFRPAVEAAGDATVDAAKASKELADREKDATDRAKKFRDQIDDLYDSLIGAIDAQRAYERSLDDSDSALADYQDTLVTSKGDQEAITDAARDTADQLIATAKSYAELGNGNLNSKAAIDDMIESLFVQATKLAPGDPLRQNLLDYIGELQQIPTQIDTTIKLRVTGQTVNITPTRNGDLIGVRALPGVAVQSAEGRYVPAGANLLSTFGEKGPEAILPLDNRNRLVQLLGDPRIGGPVADALDAAGGGGSSVSTSTTAVTVNNYRRDLTVADVAQLVMIARLQQ